jgi:hypothetical protein
MVISRSSSCLLQCSDTSASTITTAHFLGFIGDGLKRARQTLKSGGVPLSMWNIEMLEQRLSLGITILLRND